MRTLTDLAVVAATCIALTLPMWLGIAPPEVPPAAAEVAQMLEDGATPVEGFRVGEDGAMHWGCASTPEVVVCVDGFRY